MSKRITIMLDDTNIKKLRVIQSRQIKESTNSISFSKVINQQLAKELR